MPRLSAEPDTAQRILDIAARLVQTRGFNGFSYADVAAELEVTKASLHYHFPTKAELGRKLELSDIPALPLISPEDDWWCHWFAATGIAPPATPRSAGLRLDSQADEGHAAMGGQGLALLTPAFWRNDVADGRLVRPFEVTATAGYRYWLVVAPERRNVAKIRRFRDWLLAKIDRVEVWGERRPEDRTATRSFVDRNPSGVTS